MNEQEIINSLSGEALDAAKSVYKQGGSDKDVIATLKYNNLLPGQKTNVEEDNNININKKEKDSFNFWEESKKDIQEGINDIKSSTLKYVETGKYDDNYIGRFNISVEKGIHNAGTILNTGGSIMFNGIKEIWDSVGGSNLEIGKNLASTEVGKVAIATLGEGVEKWEEWKNENEENRNLGAAIEDTFNLGSWLVGGKAGQKIGKEIIKEGEKISKKSVGRANELMTEFSEKQAEKSIKKMKDEIGKLNIDSYKKATEMLQPSDNFNAVKGVGTFAKGIENISKEIENFKDFTSFNVKLSEQAQKYINKSENIAKELGPKIQLNIKNVFKPIDDAIITAKQDPQGAELVNQLLKVRNNEWERIKNGIDGLSGHERKKQLNKTLKPYYEKKELSLPETGNKQGLELLREGYKTDLDGKLGIEYKTNNTLYGDLENGQKMLKKEWDKAIKEKDNIGFIKKAAAYLLTTRAMLHISPFLPSYFSKLTPQQFIKETSRLIEKNHIKIKKLEKEILKKMKVPKFDKSKFKSSVVQLKKDNGEIIYYLIDKEKGGSVIKNIDSTVAGKNIEGLGTIHITAIPGDIGLDKFKEFKYGGIIDDSFLKKIK